MFISLLFNHRYNFRYLICFYTSTWSHWILVCLFRYFWVSKHRAKHTGQKHSCPCCPYHKAERGWLQDKHKWFTAGVWGKHERRAEKGRWQGWGCVVVIVGGVATMTTDGGGSKQMSTSWQTRPKVVKSLRDRWVSRKHRGATAWGWMQNAEQKQCSVQE